MKNDRVTLVLRIFGRQLVPKGLDLNDIVAGLELCGFHLQNDLIITRNIRVNIIPVDLILSAGNALPSDRNAEKAWVKGCAVVLSPIGQRITELADKNIYRANLLLSEAEQELIGARLIRCLASRVALGDVVLIFADVCSREAAGEVLQCHAEDAVVADGAADLCTQVIRPQARIVRPVAAPLLRAPWIAQLHQLERLALVAKLVHREHSVTVVADDAVFSEHLRIRRLITRAGDDNVPSRFGCFQFAPELISFGAVLAVLEAKRWHTAEVNETHVGRAHYYGLVAAAELGPGLLDQ